MNEKTLRKLLESVRAGEVDPDDVEACYEKTEVVPITDKRV